MNKDIYRMSKERKDSAKAFLKRLNDDENDAANIIDALEDVTCILHQYSVDLNTNEYKKINDVLMMHFYLNGAIDALKYIATNDVLNKEE